MRNIFLSTTLLIFLLAGCDIMQSPESEEISEQNLDLATRIIGSTLTDEDAGILTTFYDASSDVLNNEIGSGNHHGRGDESDYEYDYNPDTGWHTVHFVRNMERRDMVKTLDVKSEYRYTDAAGSFLEIDRRTEEGREMWDLIETIEYTSTREGETISSSRTHEFFRFDDLYFEGVSSSVITLDGTHEANGTMNVEDELPDCPGSRTYAIFLDFEGIQLDKTVVENNGTIEEGLSGFINYDMTVDGEDLKGTIELEKGEAWVQFYRVPDFFRIALADGSITGNARRGQRGDGGNGGRHGSGDNEGEGEGEGGQHGHGDNEGEGGQHGHGDDEDKGGHDGEGNRHGGDKEDGDNDNGDNGGRGNQHGGGNNSGN